uniref:NADH-ubiquinone oxidoreductase chain 3 n=1 Tax=Polypterus teugelsi TaxID=764557 RepID=F2W4S8_9ACTI|nr:NADH dehydrogenase subunit 3 [Polypterus teugelsi]ADG95316.1 NADH dehydrogenase subunit 3 [Polypterus teugelsi]
MNLILTMILISSSISITLSTIAFWLPQTSPDSEKLSPYECGFDPHESTYLPFSIRFFLIAILFLLFDLEVALLLPLPWSIHLNPTLTLTWMFIIIMLLAAGLIYEWLQGGLEWAE